MNIFAEVNLVSVKVSRAMVTDAPSDINCDELYLTCRLVNVRNNRRRKRWCRLRESMFRFRADEVGITVQVCKSECKLPQK